MQFWDLGFGTGNLSAERLCHSVLGNLGAEQPCRPATGYFAPGNLGVERSRLSVPGHSASRHIGATLRSSGKRTSFREIFNIEN